MKKAKWRRIFYRPKRTERNHKHRINVRGLHSFNVLELFEQIIQILPTKMVCWWLSVEVPCCLKTIVVIMLNCEWRLVLNEENSWEAVVGRDWSRFAKDTSCHYARGCGVAQRSGHHSATRQCSMVGATHLSLPTDWLSAGGGPRGDIIHIQTSSNVAFSIFESLKRCFIERAKPVRVSTSSVQTLVDRPRRKTKLCARNFWHNLNFSFKMVFISFTTFAAVYFCFQMNTLLVT